MTLDEMRQALAEGEALIFEAFPEREESIDELQRRTVPAVLIKELSPANERHISSAIFIANAIIDGDLDLSHFRFEKDFKIEQSRFTGLVDFSMATFEHAASFAKSSFAKNITGRAARITYDLNLERCQFRQDVQLTDADIQQIFSCVGSTFEGNVSLDRLYVGKAAIFSQDGKEPAEFKKNLLLHSAKIAGHLGARACVFHGTVVLDGSSVLKNVSFEEVRFADRVRLTGMQIGDQFILRGARCEADTKLEQMVIGGASFFQSTPGSKTFFKEVSFGGTCFKGQVVFIGAELGKANFFNTRFEGELLFQDVSFSGLARFERIHVQGGLYFGGKTKFDKDFKLISSYVHGQTTFQTTVFNGHVNLENTIVDEQVAFEGKKECPVSILGAVNLKFVKFGAFGCAHAGFTSLDCTGSEFGRIAISSSEFKGPVILDGTTIRSFAQFNEGVIFHDKFCMRFAYIEGTLDGSNARFAEECTFDGTKCGRQAVFINVKFEDNANFSSFEASADAAFQGAAFSKHANFHRMRVGSSLLFRAEPQNNISASIFHGQATFSRINVGLDANFRDVQFLGLSTEISFDSAIIKKNAVFVGSKFSALVRFIAIQVGGQASFQGATFMAPVTFDAAAISGRLLFRSEPSRNLAAAVFNDVADFRDCSIGSTAEFHNTKFLGKVNFERVDFGGSAIFVGASFENAVSVNKFGVMKCKQGAYFQASRFTGKTDFHGITIYGEFVCSGVVFGDRTTFEGSTFFDSAYFGAREGLASARFSEVVFSFCKFERIADFEGATFSGLLVLRETYMRAALFSTNTTSQFSSTIDARGFQYDSISIDWKHFFHNAEGKTRVKPFNRQPYTQLEKALRTAGHDRDADQVYLERRLVERKLKWHESKLSWFVDFLYWTLGRYGIRPYQLFLIAFMVVFIGVGVYSSPSSVKVSMEADGKKTWTVVQSVTVADATELSLREFFPIDLPLVPQYEPWEKNRLSSCFASILKISGWLILPIGIAAITGLLRRVGK